MDYNTIVPGSASSVAEGDGAKSTIEILVVDDEESLLDSCTSVLRHEGYSVTGCGRGWEARELLQRRGFDVVFLDLHMAQVSGMELLRSCLDARPETIAVMMTGNPSVASSMEALQAGAWEYLPKPFSASHLQILAGRASYAVLATRSGAAGPPAPAGGRRSRPKSEATEGERVVLLGNSPPLLKAIQLARTVAGTDASVFITGESGSGKEVIAQFIHQNSRRRNEPLVAINCAALPEALLESEMFGHCKGAFTGATRDKPGLLEAADGGTLFLDELTEMSLPIQAKLLRVIQDGIVRRVGSETVDAVVNVRFIAATNRDPRAAVQEGHLRKDLYYRLSVVPLPVPPLRDRVEDIPILAEHFLRHYWQRHRDPEAPLPTLSPATIQALRARSWHGNVRELQNVIEHAAVLLDPGREALPADIPDLDDPGRELAEASSQRVGLQQFEFQGYHDAREQVTTEFELRYLKWLIETAGSNMSRAARIAGVDRTTLYRLMEKHGLHRDTVITASRTQN